MHISIIGSGNVAWHIAKASIVAKHVIDCVTSKTIANAQLFAQTYNTQYVETIKKLPLNSDIYIIAVSDNAINDVLKDFPLQVNGIVVHTSGATDIEILSKQKQYGVLYPCQTLSKATEIDYRNLPFFIEGNNESTLQKIEEFAKRISTNISYANSLQRRKLHVAAVVASNFTNHLLLLAQQYMTQNGLDFKMLKPLIEQTISKALQTDPFSAQTGPARRHDTKTIDAHQKLIDDNNLLKIYQLLTNSIEKTYNK